MGAQRIILLVFLLSCACAPTSTETTPVGQAPANSNEGSTAAAMIPMPSAQLDHNITLSRIIFASCARQDLDQSIWDRIALENPDLILFMGDNVYGDSNPSDPQQRELAEAYNLLARSKPFSRARAAAPLLTAWDDHDYGANDVGAAFEHKEVAEQIFEDAWALPEDDPRRARPGVYGSWIIGEAGRQVQIILLDTRFFRSAFKPTDERGARGKERYLPDPDPTKTMLGDVQWAWLEEELKKPADLRLFVSSVQVIADGHGWEAWKMLPTERERLYTLFDKTGAENLMMLTGDRHSAGLYRRDDVIAYPLFEATSSSLNRPLTDMVAPDDLFMEPGPNRLGDMYQKENYGVIDIDWVQQNLDVTIRDKNGAVVLRELVALESLN